MSRPVALVFVLVLLILTSQFEWNQQFVNEAEPNLVLSKQQQISHNQELIKEQIILTQEKKIHELNELVNILQQQLMYCKAPSTTSNISVVGLDTRR